MIKDQNLDVFHRIGIGSGNKGLCWYMHWGRAETKRAHCMPHLGRELRLSGLAAWVG